MSKLTDISTFEPLTPEQWPLVTDITLDENKDSQTGKWALNLKTARCQIGDNKPRLLFNLGVDHDDDAEYLQRLGTVITAAQQHPDYRHKKVIRFSAEGLTFRLSRAVGYTDTARLQMRLIQEPENVPDLETLPSLPPYLADFLMIPEFKRGGLVLVTAPTGQGKSTTLAATIKSRLRKFDGQGMTIEDPIEAHLTGYHGFGECFQTEIDSKDPDACAERIRDLLRDFSTFPGGNAMLYITEIRDTQTACEALNAAAAGFLVLASIHSQGPLDTVQRLLSYTMPKKGEVTARTELSEALRLVIHQTLVLNVQGTDPWKRASMTAKILYNPPGASEIATVIRDKSLSGLADPIQKQNDAIRTCAGAGMPFSELMKTLGYGSR